jgi:multidrug efflux pump subunit AcrA (membrane-fusion protein)
MSETPDISEARTIPAMAAIPPSAPGPMDFGPLIDDTEDADFTPMPPMSGSRRRRPRWLPWLIVGLLVILVGGGLFAFLRTSHSTPIQYTQSAATSGNLTVSVTGSGPVSPNAVYDLNFSASAPITAIYVKVGDRVTKGQKLAALDPTTLQDAVNQAQDTVNNAETSLGQAETSLSDTENQQSTALSIAKLNENKALAACTPSSTAGASGTATTTPTATPNVSATATAESNCKKLARAQYAQSQQQSNSSITSGSNQVASAEQQVTNAQTALQTAKDNLKNDVLLAPHAGLIETVNGLIGETSSSGNSSSSSSSSTGSSSAFIVLIDDSTLSIQASVAEADIASIQVGQPATFTVAAYPSQTFQASVASVDTMGATSSSVVTYSVDLAVDMQSLNGAHVYSGMTATTSITTAERISTLLVPSAALTFEATALSNGEITRAQLTSLVSGAGTTTGTRGIVIELQAGKLVPVLVTTGLTNGTQTEILSGLKEGDEVVVGQTGGTTTTTSSSSTSGGTRSGGGGFGGGGFGGGGNVLVPTDGN